MNKNTIFKRCDIVFVFDAPVVGSISKEFFLDALQIKGKDKDNPNYNFIDFGLAKGFHMIEKKISIIFEQQRLRCESKEIAEPSADVLFDLVTPIFEKIDTSVKIIGYGFNLDVELIGGLSTNIDILGSKLKELQNTNKTLKERAGIIFEEQSGKQITVEIIKDMISGNGLVTTNFNIDNQEIKLMDRAKLLKEAKKEFEKSVLYFKNQIVSKFCL